MKKLLSVLLLACTLTGQAFAASQWTKTAPSGGSSAADIDTNVATTNNEALDRLVVRYKRGLGVNYSSASTLSVLTGEIAIPDGSDSVVRWRRQASADSIGWSNIDTGAEENSTQYYVYATADTDITGMVFKVSKSSSAPSGMTYYRKIAEFYNDSSGNITNVKSLRDDDGTDYQDVVKAWINFDGTTGTINDSYNVTSLTDNGTGDFTVTFDTDFANGNYACSSMSQNVNNPASGVGSMVIHTVAAGSIRVKNYNSVDAAVDPTIAMIVCTGDRT